MLLNFTSKFPLPACSSWAFCLRSLWKTPTTMSSCMLSLRSIPIEWAQFPWQILNTFLQTSSTSLKTDLFRKIDEAVLHNDKMWLFTSTHSFCNFKFKIAYWLTGHDRIKGWNFFRRNIDGCPRRVCSTYFWWQWICLLISYSGDDFIFYFFPTDLTSMV